MKVYIDGLGRATANPRCRELTQEDVIEQGWTCKACDAPHVFGEVCEAEGDLYCWTCGLAIDLMDGEMWTVRVLSTREQVAEEARWEAAGISTR